MLSNSCAASRAFEHGELRAPDKRPRLCRLCYTGRTDTAVRGGGEGKRNGDGCHLLFCLWTDRARPQWVTLRRHWKSAFSACFSLYFCSFLVPGEPPNSVSVTPHTTSSVLVQWQVSRIYNIKSKSRRKWPGKGKRPDSSWLIQRLGIACCMSLAGGQS